MFLVKRMQTEARTVLKALDNTPNAEECVRQALVDAFKAGQRSKEDSAAQPDSNRTAIGEAN